MAGDHTIEEEESAVVTEDIVIVDGAPIIAATIKLGSTGEQDGGEDAGGHGKGNGYGDEDRFDP